MRSLQELVSEASDIETMMKFNNEEDYGMSTAIATHETKAVARPLHVLVPLIKEDIQRGKDAADRAGLPYFRSAGEKMLEAKEQIKHGEFKPWLKRNFDVSYETSRRWMGLVNAEKTQARVFSSVNAALKSSGDPGYMPNKPRPQAWHEPVREIINKVDVDTLRQSALARAEEREAQRKLAIQLIDIGYKALATKLHPDRGGSRDAMSRLNQVRDRLKGAA